MPEEEILRLRRKTVNLHRAQTYAVAVQVERLFIFAPAEIVAHEVLRTILRTAVQVVTQLADVRNLQHRGIVSVLNQRADAFVIDT